MAEPAHLNVIECVEKAELGDASISRGSLILVDVDAIAGLQCLHELKVLAPQSGLILWVDWISPEFIREVLNTGVRGILRKTASPRLYEQCLENVGTGQLWLENEMNQKLLSDKAIRLSPRERQLVGLLIEGLRNKEIATRMNITEGTVKAYLSRLFEKTGASDRFELAMFALRNLETNPAAGPSRGPRIFLPLRTAFSKRA